MHRIATTPVAQPTHAAHPWLFAGLTAIAWFEVLWLASAASDHGLPPRVAAIAGLASQLAFTAVEASLGVAAWAVMGARVRWSALAPRLLAASAAEAFAVAVAAGRPALPPPWAVLLAGFRAAPEGGSGGVFIQAFAAFGVLALVRMALAGFAHAESARVPWTRAMLVVVGFYLASRCAMWWTLDLMRGHSFEDPPLP